MRIIFICLLIIFKINLLSAQNAQEYFNLGIQKKDIRNYEGAIQDFDKAVALNPGFFQAYSLRAFSKSELFQIVAATRDYDKAIAINPNDTWALGNCALLKVRIGYYREAVDYFTRLIRLEPQNVWAYLMRAEAKYKALKSGFGKRKLYSYFEIVDDYSRVLSFTANNAFAFKKRGEARLDSLNSAKYIPQPQEVEAICADWYKARELGDTEANLLIQKHCESALIPALIKKNLDAGLQKEVEENFAAAIKLYEVIIQSGFVNLPEYKTAIKRRADCKYRLKDYWGTIDDYTTLISLLNPNDYQTQIAYYRRGLAKAELQNHMGALEDFDKAIEAGYNQSRIYFERGIVKNMLGEKIGACTDWNKSKAMGCLEAGDMLKKYCKK